MFFSKKSLQPPGSKKVPVVKGRLPFVGNGISFSKDIVGYIRKCYKTYGPIFKLKIYNTEMIVVCDRQLIDEYFSKRENEMSLYKVLDRLYFSEAFSDDPGNLDIIIRTVKRTVKVDFNIFAPKIMEEASKMVKRMKNNSISGKKVNLQEEIIRFIASTSSRCFISYDISDSFFNDLMEFSHLVNRIVVLTYFLPKLVLSCLYGRKLRSIRKKLIDAIEPTIQSYRDDPKKTDSTVIRKSIDMDKTLSNRQIGEILVCLLYISSENTALGLKSALIDLACHPKWWENVKKATKDSVHFNNYNSIFSDKVVDACTMESARINTHILALNRQPVKGINTLGEYYVGDTDCVALCEPMLMMYEASHDKFSRPETYNPDRFITDNEPSDSKSVMTWGAGVHLCPGKMFALYEIKMGLAMITNTFDIFTVSNPKKDYFSPAAFAEYTADITLKVLDEKDE